MSLMVSDDERRSDYARSFGLGNAAATDIHGRYTTKAIPSGQSRDAACRPRTLGVLEMNSFLPVSMCPGGVCVLEMVFADVAASCCDTTTGHGTLWHVSDLVCNVDVLAIDATFLTSVLQHLYGGNVLQMQYSNRTPRFSHF